MNIKRYIRAAPVLMALALPLQARADAYDDMMRAKVVAVSKAAQAVGIAPGMTGAEALRILS